MKLKRMLSAVLMVGLVSCFNLANVQAEEGAVPAPVSETVAATTSEATVAATTSDVAAVATPEASAEAVVETKSEATPVVTPEATVAATPEPTPEVKAEPAAEPMEFSPMTELMLFSDEILVMSATKRLQKLSEVPGSVTIITEKEIAESGALTLFEVLRNITNVSFANEGLFNTMRFRGMQASYNNKILVLVDGRKMNILDWGNFDGYFTTNLTNVKQIEVIKGPGSSLYGANAYAGVVSIITKSGAELNGLKTEVSVGNKPGDFELSQKHSLTYGKKQGDFDYKVATSYWRQKGIDPFNDPYPNDIHDGYEASFSVNYKDNWGINGGYQRAVQPWSGSVYTPTPKNTQETEIMYVDANYNIELNELSKLKVRLTDNYYLNKNLRTELWDLDRIQINSLSDLPTPAPVVIVNGDTSAVSYDLNEAVGNLYINLNDFLNIVTGDALAVGDLGKGQMNELSAEVQYDLAWPKNNYLLAGASIKYDWSNQDFYKESTVTDENYAVFVQDEYHINDELLLLAGVRYDYNNDYGSNISPRGSLIYEPIKGLRAKALYGSAFRSPLMLERFTLSDYGFYEVTGIDNLKPESIEQAEASIEYEIGKWFHAKAGYFYWETQNEIQFAYTFGSLYIYSPDLSLINPAMPPFPGLLYLSQMNSAPALVSWDNSNSRIGHGLELETTFTPNEYARIKLNYARVDLYARNQPVHPSWDQGIADTANGVLELHYKDLVFLNFYANVGRIPMKINTAAEEDAGTGIGNTSVLAKWMQQYDVSIGGKYKGFSLVATAFNVFDNPVAYDTLNNDYLRSEPIYRINAGYTLEF